MLDYRSEQVTLLDEFYGTTSFATAERERIESIFEKNHENGNRGAKYLHLHRQQKEEL